MASASVSIDATVAHWQPDEAVSLCPLCQRRFTWFYRKHHCRKCGQVVCSSCSSSYTSIPFAQIVRQPDPEMPAFLNRLAAEFELQRALYIESEQVRTCDSCVSVLEQEQCRRILGLDHETRTPEACIPAQTIRETATASSLLTSPPPSYSRAPKPVTPSIADRVPDNDANRARRSSASHHIGSHGHRHSRRAAPASEHSASTSLPARSATPQHIPLLPDVVPLRFVAFQLNDHDKMVGDECPICFEEYEPLQQIARLECWCVFHVKCIKAWKSQKAGTGGCPLHFHDS